MDDVLKHLQALRISKNVATSAISIVSHDHERARRAERGVDKREQQEAIKYGVKERANPGREGQTRWRYTHQGVVVIMDETSRHAITTWRLADARGPAPAPQPEPEPKGRAAGGAHMVLIVDHSGSMRSNDVPGYPNRISAVYDCLMKDLVQPQLDLNTATGSGADSMLVSLVQMSDSATVAFSRMPADKSLMDALQGAAAKARGASHGHYLRALDAALELLLEDKCGSRQLCIMFLSDGAPSDHLYLNRLPAAVKAACVKRVKNIGDELGRDRVSIHTVAFGPPEENYEVLHEMAAALPRRSCQKLGLSAACLRTGFTSVASTLASMRTEAGSGLRLTLRTDIAVKAERLALTERQVLRNGHGWDIYVGSRFEGKWRWNVQQTKGWEQVPVQRLNHWTSHGLALARHKFAEGAERVVYQCSEVESRDGGATGICVGPRLVAKRTRYQEKLHEAGFQETFCRAQAEAEELAQLFNRRLAGPPEWQLRFLPCYNFIIKDQRYLHHRNGQVEVLVEEELEGRYMKWNNNAGGVYRNGVATDPTFGVAPTCGTLGAIGEEDEEVEAAGRSSSKGCTDDVPQAFSHFSYSATGGKKLVCDLQGVWNPTDGFTLTDPVIHHHSGKKRNGATDKGAVGMWCFFATHTCNALCRRLGLEPGPGQPAQ